MVCLSKGSDKGLTLETSAKHHIPMATNIPYQPLLIKPIFHCVAVRLNTGHMASFSFTPTGLGLVHVPIHLETRSI